MRELKNLRVNRRQWLGHSISGLGLLGIGGGGLSSLVTASPLLDYRSLRHIGPLQAPDIHGLRLPRGFSSRPLASSGSAVRLAEGRLSSHLWHEAPDGGACYPTEDGGWIYVSNSEVDHGKGGAGALRFDRVGRLVDAYPILSGTDNNCAGGATPWGTWLSCEEVERGRVFECDIYGNGAELRQGLGFFEHEAVAIDPIRMQAYLTEDTGDGCFYRYTPQSVNQGRMDLDRGRLEVAIVDGGTVSWQRVSQPNPSSSQTATRYQVRDATAFDGGEGIWYHEGRVTFTTKGDNRVWQYEIETQQITVIYDRRTAKNPILSGVDNVTITGDGHVLVAEDGGDMQICVIGPAGDVFPLLQIVNQDDSEITGPAISPSGDRLYFSSQRGGSMGKGLTYEVLGLFH
ncbi:alkaline phosphatase PhoX [Oligoflexus tunisiensis]|uniref:alkaline phosphatase PhoX n=1 Tax=Oligoflexus tunisiensis TaxID=708132 RepID=UPI000AED2F1E|nr:alkaline phosphatase PhoX [Oligoflexus tunisiensis]